MSRKEVRAEINTLRAELNSWLNTTLSILKTNLVEQSKLAPYTHTLYRGPLGSRRGALDGAKSATTCTTSLRIAYEIILAIFNLAVSTLTVKPPNLLFSCLIFRLCGMYATGCTLEYFTCRYGRVCLHK